MTFTDADSAALYDRLNPWNGPDAAFYDRLVDDAGAVLDVGCGTGQLLRSARGRGHTGRLVGLDPDAPSLDRARLEGTVEWVRARADEARWEAEFDLAVMSSNAFQCLVTDDDLRASLAAVRRALKPGGRFAFDTRYPGAREWERWPEAEIAVDDLVVSYDVESVADGVVTFTESTSRDGAVLRVDRASLRFLEVGELNDLLRQAGFSVQHQFGDWHGGPVTLRSGSVVTVALNRL
ncbi:class I SAM-dependent methyltransferase [Lentzea sp. NBRC 102530]|uniref:class I SAM-dependent methyltransferase n=1 Tax=Lentzea sp. NBRC 102530 TaxID=3032201 RepID=UPI00249FDB7D|nr:class I SAM-dependent methyltransferase [Lentzea sp. NBRC 102530]GLY54763.1 methyltransferase [Lentzea sp. NBRC 102530]